MAGESAAQAMLSEFDYFTPTLLQSSIIDEYDEAIGTSTAIAPNGNALGVFDFTIPGAADLYRDLNNSYLMIKLKVTDAAGANLGANDAVAPSNLPLHTMFANVSMTICGREISEKDSNYPYRAYLETLLTYDDAVLKTRALTEGWAKDDAGRMSNVTLAPQQGQPAPNEGFLARKKLILQSRTFTLVGRPHLDLFHQNLDIPPGCTIDIKFTPSPVAFAFTGAAAHAAVKVSVMATRLYVRTKKVCPELVLAHKEMLQKCNMHIPLNHVTVQKYGIAAGFTSSNIQLNFPAKLPKRVFLGFVLDTAASGLITENPFNFQHFGITSVTLKVNGQKMPADDLECDYTLGDYQRAYLNTLATLGLDTGSRGISITPEEFAAGYNIYGYKIAPGPIDGVVFSSANSIGSLVVEVKFSQGLGHNIQMIVFAEAPAILEIDKLSSATLV